MVWPGFPGRGSVAGCGSLPGRRAGGRAGREGYPASGLAEVTAARGHGFPGSRLSRVRALGGEGGEGLEDGAEEGDDLFGGGEVEAAGFEEVAVDRDAEGDRD